jgi:predicted RNA-binding protein YlqC (UPF0109 family)
VIKELVDYVVKSLVDDPTEVFVTEVISGSDVIVEVRVAPTDMGRVIGRNGKVINAIRTLAQMVAAREAKRAQLEIVE